MDTINKLIGLGWHPIPYLEYNDYDFYLWKQFEVSKSNELNLYTDYIPEKDEKIFVVYEIYPNRPHTRWCIWNDNYNPTYIVWEYDDYEIVIELALEDRLFTYPR